MIAAYYLIISISQAGSTSVPMETKELCEAAKAQYTQQIKDNFGNFQANIVSCVKAKENWL